MSSRSKSLDTWKALLDRKARHLHEQIAATHVWVKENAKGDSEAFDNLTRQLYGWLRDLYEHELPLARILDEADLSLELEGPDTKVSHPRISLVSNMFQRVQRQVRAVAHSIPGITERVESSGVQRKKRQYFSHELDLGFASMALNDVLRVGFTLPAPDPGNLLGEDDPAFKAVREAVESIKVVSLSMAEFDDDEEIRESVSKRIRDPKVLDSTLIAVKEMTPSTRSGIEAVRIYGKGSKPEEIGKPLTLKSRTTLNQMIAKPVHAEEEIEITGLVREIDLDERRFELRQITGGVVNDLRCVYGKEAKDSVAKQWLDDQIVVFGRVQKDASGRPRLMKVLSLRSKGEKEGGKQMEIRFEDD